MKTPCHPRLTILEATIIGTRIAVEYGRVRGAIDEMRLTRRQHDSAADASWRTTAAVFNIITRSSRYHVPPVCCFHNVFRVFHFFRFFHIFAFASFTSLASFHVTQFHHTQLRDRSQHSNCKDVAADRLRSHLPFRWHRHSRESMAAKLRQRVHIICTSHLYPRRCQYATGILRTVCISSELH